MQQHLWILGPKGTHAHQAAVSLMSTRPELRDMDIRFVDRNHQVFHQLSEYRNSYGLVPVENVRAGLVAESFQYWLNVGSQSDLRIQVVGEVWEPIRHHLLASEAVKPESLSLILSHDQALQQCATNLAQWGKPTQATTSTARAASMVAGSHLPYGALASRLAADVYGLKVLVEDVQDSPHNATQFFLLSARGVDPAADDQTAVLFHLENRVGALNHVTDLIAEVGVNLSSIHSIPLGKRGAFAFYVTFSGHQKDEATKSLLAELRERATNLIVLGSFPRWTT